MRERAAEAELVYEDDAIRIGYVDRLVVNSWFGPSTARQLRMLGDLQAERAKEIGGRLGTVSIISLAVGKQLDGEARKEAARVKSESAEYSVGNATVILDTGFFASIVRGINASLELLARGDLPSGFFREVAEAVDWLSERLVEAGHEVDPSACATAAAQVMD